MLYFRGNLTYGIDMIGILEDKIVKQKKELLSMYIGRSWTLLSSEEFDYWWKELAFDKMQDGVYEGEKPEYIYYEKDLRIHRVKAKSFKGLLIRIFGEKVKL